MNTALDFGAAPLWDNNPLLAGQRFGMLTVLSYAGKNEYGLHMYLCRCDCGTEKVISKSSLTFGNTKSCGCLRREKNPLLPGQRFGKLVVRNRIPHKQFCYDGVRYLCKCDCGNDVIAQKSGLLRGSTHSCGCDNPHHNLPALEAGQKFGMLTVLGFERETKTGAETYRCLCACGKETVVTRSNLVHGNTKSCGCAREALPKGMRFGHLTVRGRAGRDPWNKQLYFCDCDCGGTAVVRKTELIAGTATGCGCRLGQPGRTTGE